MVSPEPSSKTRVFPLAVGNHEQEHAPSDGVRIDPDWPAVPTRAGGSRAAGFRAEPGGRTEIAGPPPDGAAARPANNQALRRRTCPNPIADGPKGRAGARSAGRECYGYAGSDSVFAPSCVAHAARIPPAGTLADQLPPPRLRRTQRGAETCASRRGY